MTDPASDVVVPPDWRKRIFRSIVKRQGPVVGLDILRQIKADVRHDAKATPEGERALDECIAETAEGLAAPESLN